LLSQNGERESIKQYTILSKSLRQKSKIISFFSKVAYIIAVFVEERLKLKLIPYLPDPSYIHISFMIAIRMGEPIFFNFIIQILNKYARNNKF